MFMACSLFSGIGWIVLIFVSPYWKDFDKFLISVVIVVLALVYAGLNFSQPIMQTMKDFSNFEGVLRIFTNETLVNAAWVHFLTFDLFVGVWVKKDSLRQGISHAWIIPSLIFCCVFGPLGYLVYLLTRRIKSKTPGNASGF